MRMPFLPRCQNPYLGREGTTSEITVKAVRGAWRHYAMAPADASSLCSTSGALRYYADCSSGHLRMLMARASSSRYTLRLELILYRSMRSRRSATRPKTAFDVGSRLSLALLRRPIKSLVGASTRRDQGPPWRRQTLFTTAYAREELSDGAYRTVTS